MRSSRGTGLTTLGIVAVATSLGLGVVSASPPQRQPPAIASARFDAASIKPSKLDAVIGNGFRITPGHLLTVNTTLDQLVRFAYELDLGDQAALSGGPRWISSDRFEIEGKADGMVLLPGLRGMLKSLLADRFNLKLHEDMKERDVYTLAVARSDGRLGLGLRPTPGDEAAYCASIESKPSPDPEFTPDGMRRCAAGSRGGIKLRGRPLADLARMLGELVGRPVVDRTGLNQRFDADLNAALNWDHLVFGGASDTLGGNAVIFTALREQLGLSLKPARAAVRAMVIDSVERPSAD